MERCVEGYDDKGVVCATCSTEYVLQGQRCVFCEGRKDAAVFSSELLIFAFLTQPTLTKNPLFCIPGWLTSTVCNKIGSVKIYFNVYDHMKEIKILFKFKEKIFLYDIIEECW